MPRSFSPVVGRSARILILGSMPGLASLRAKQYYAHPRNQFWRLLGDVLRAELRSAPYSQRLRLLKARGIALWDVIGSCSRRGSLDSAIRAERPNPVADLLARRPGIKAVFFNGRKAQEAFFRHFSTVAAEPGKFHLLPSSSPAHAALSYRKKLRRWQDIF